MVEGLVLRLLVAGWDDVVGWRCKWTRPVSLTGHLDRAGRLFQFHTISPRTNRSGFYTLYGSEGGLARAALEQVCGRARTGEVDQDSMDLVVVVTRLELAPVDDAMRKLADQAFGLCFAGDPHRVGEHLLARTNRTRDREAP